MLSQVQEFSTNTGLVVDTRARFGFTAAPGTTDDARIRHLTLDLPPQYVARLFEAQDAGASEQQLHDIAAKGLGECISATEAAALTTLKSNSPT
jgi:hypothetical protein